MGLNTEALERDDVKIEFNIVQAHYEIRDLRRALIAAEAQRDSFKEGLRDYAESIWRERTYLGREPNKSLDQFIDDAEKDYTLA